ncbi:pyridoxal phosphate-dependent aminotransferase, partial [Candidatus Bipolaricaulota bacterium]|nr:pyridoxal phosphate-dependent aminotransferase [Candidatus Bipolaricaulota bacterium]
RSGLREVRQGIVNYYADNGIELDPDQIIVTVGGSEAGLFAFYVALEPGQEILIPEPFYTNYRGFAKMSGTEIAPIPSRAEDDFALPDRGVMQDLISKNTGALLLTNPSNPTGRVYTKKELERARDIALENDLYFISDEVYREFVYDGNEAISILQLKNIDERGILIDSISKRLSVCGARIGVIASRNREFNDAVSRLSQARLSPPTFGQLGLLNFLKSSAYPGAIDEMVERYRRRRDVLLEELAKIPGTSFSRPGGAFYLMVRLPVDDSEEFVKWMITDFRHKGESVMLAPGGGFYASEGEGSNEVRISYVLNRNDLARASELIGVGLYEYRNS